jgi:hypothetical protein
LEDALKRLDELTHEEARMAAAEVLRTAHVIGERVRLVRDRVATIDDKITDCAQKLFSAKHENFLR